MSNVTNASQPKFAYTRNGDNTAHANEVKTRASFEGLAQVEDAGAVKGTEDHATISADTVQAYLRSQEGMSDEQAKAAVSGQEEFNMDTFTALVSALPDPNSSGAPTPLPAPADQPATLGRTKQNDPEAVKALQTQLASMKGPDGKPLYQGEIDGKYGKGTEAAVKAFQESVGQVDANGKADGIAGPITQAALKEASEQQAALEADAKRPEAIADAVTDPGLPPADDATLQENGEGPDLLEQEKRQVDQAAVAEQKAKLLPEEMAAAGIPPAEILDAANTNLKAILDKPQDQWTDEDASRAQTYASYINAELGARPVDSFSQLSTEEGTKLRDALDNSNDAVMRVNSYRGKKGGESMSPKYRYEDIAGPLTMAGF